MAAGRGVHGLGRSCSRDYKRMLPTNRREGTVSPAAKHSRSCSIHGGERSRNFTWSLRTKIRAGAIVSTELQLKRIRCLMKGSKMMGLMM